MSPAPRSRTLPKRPDLNQLKRQAKELLESFRVGDPDATADVHAQYHGADPRTFALHDAQLVVARAYGFESWPKLKAFVERMTVHRLVDAIRARDTATVQQLLARRPELVRMSIDNLHVLHYAVLADTPDVVRLLMAHGANAREGVYPYREATTAHALAVQRGHDEIVRVIELAEQEQRNALSGAQDAPAADDLFRAIAAGSSDRAIALMSVDPRQIHSRHVPSQLSPLHAAAQALDDALVAWLLEHGAEPAVRMHHPIAAVRERTRRTTAGVTAAWV